MNNQQLREGYLKGEVARLTQENLDLIKRLNQKNMIDHLLAQALGGACSKCETPRDAAIFAMEAADHLLNLLSGGEAQNVSDVDGKAGDAVPVVSG